MRRGSNALYQKLFVEPNCKLQKKGRSQTLNARRNELLLERFYYYGQFSQMRYEIIISMLSEEFFLSPVTIPQIIEDNVMKLKSTKAALKEKSQKEVKNILAKKWPHLQWDVTDNQNN